jgi:hypothetical protein
MTRCADDPGDRQGGTLEDRAAGNEHEGGWRSALEGELRAEIEDAIAGGQPTYG